MKKKIIHFLFISLFFVMPLATFANTTKHDKNIDNLPAVTPKAERLNIKANPKSYKVFGKQYHVLNSNQDFQQRGTASWYGPHFHGKHTASGEVYDMYALTAAHKSLPIPCYIRVTNLENGKQLIVKVNDRGPFYNDRIIDLSYSAAKKLGVLQKGTARVQIEGIPPFQYVNKATMAEKLFLQLGAFGEENNAKQYAEQVEKITDNPVNIFASNFYGKNIYRVKIGPLHDELHGTVVNKLLEAAGLSHGTLIRV
jgi:rare lipoprotein A